MNRFTIFLISVFFCVSSAISQENAGQKKDNDAIITLIADYSLARENRDTVLLKKILTPDIDQLVSNGEWRRGITAAVQGMLRSSATNPGTRTLTVDKIRFMDGANAVADARYEITNDDGSLRKMWSTFIVVKRKGQWKITGIRNMLPATL
jgi:ketosteroid isomerase-like protein